jgi:biopolymer transport protein ExbB
LLSIIQATGWPIWPLILCSILAVALIIERLVQLRPVQVIPPHTLESAIEMTLNGFPSTEQIGQLEKAGSLGPILADGLRTLEQSPTISNGEVRESMEMAGRLEARHLERYLTAIGTIASAAPLLGLLGTVIGMIEIFGSQSPSNGQPAQLAHGISIALYNTAFGLVVAIPTLMFWRYFRAQVDNYLLTMEAAADRFARHLAQLRN